MSTEHPAQVQRPSRPWSVTFTAFGVFILAVYYLTRWVAVLRDWEFYREVLIPYANVYLLVSGLIGSIAGLLLAVGLWTGSRWAPGAIQIGAPLYLMFRWIERLAVDRVNSQIANGPFLLVISVLILVWLVWNFSRPTVRQYFGEKHER
jgi:hypothetical protein